MNACRYILGCLSDENRGSSAGKRFLCLLGLMCLAVLPGVFLMALLVGADEEVEG